jgi:hypothetical protein
MKSRYQVLPELTVFEPLIDDSAWPSRLWLPYPVPGPLFPSRSGRRRAFCGSSPPAARRQSLSGPSALEDGTHPLWLPCSTDTLSLSSITETRLIREMGRRSRDGLVTHPSNCGDVQPAMTELSMHAGRAKM